jgi:hypothetical protein
MTWTFIWLMFLLKIPIAGLLWLVWWAIHKADEEPIVRDDDGGTKVDLGRQLHRRPPRPPRPRRGPHCGAPPPAPQRIRSVVARARVEH